MYRIIVYRDLAQRARHRCVWQDDGLALDSALREAVRAEQDGYLYAIEALTEPENGVYVYEHERDNFHRATR